MIRIARTDCNFDREPLLAAFGFKGGYLTELWQTVALMESESGALGMGLGTQSILWSDADVFAAHTETAGNSLMHLVTAHALKCAEGMTFSTPLDLLDELLPLSRDYANRISTRPDLRLTFVLNALVAADNAAWQLYCAETGKNDFDSAIPEHFRQALSYRHHQLACIPLMTYGVPLEEIVRAVDEGYFLLKIKIGADPDKDGDPDKMLRWDMDRLSSIHAAVKDRETPHTQTGHIPYYLDANGRYDSKERLLRLLDHAQSIGALERIILLEEPFPEEYRVDVTDLPVRLAADESAHSDNDALERIEMGYRAIALKPIAKTMSMSLRIAAIARANDVPCFCADLTVNPILVDWNKNVAARLAPLPGLKIGALEQNGHQNYRNWDAMKTYHPCGDASWTKTLQGVFHLGDDFYAQSGGIFRVADHYRALVR